MASIQIQALQIGPGVRARTRMCGQGQQVDGRVYVKLGGGGARQLVNGQPHLLSQQPGQLVVGVGWRNPGQGRRRAKGDKIGGVKVVGDQLPAGREHHLADGGHVGRGQQRPGAPADVEAALQIVLGNETNQPPSEMEGLAGRVGIDQDRVIGHAAGEGRRIGGHDHRLQAGNGQSSLDEIQRDGLAGLAHHALRLTPLRDTGHDQQR